MKTVDYFDAVKRRYGWDSDYRLAKELHISRQAVSNIRNRGITMGDLTCLRVAELLNINPGVVLLDVLAERTNCSPVSKVLRSSAAFIKRGALCLLICTSMVYGFLLPYPAHAFDDMPRCINVYYVKYCPPGAFHLDHYITALFGAFSGFAAHYDNFSIMRKSFVYTPRQEFSH